MKYTVTVQKLDHYGRGIAFLDGKITFISNALPNEIVEIMITKSTKKFNEANVLEYLQYSEDRIEPICPYYGLCGGCDIMHMKNELDFKMNKVKDIISRYTLMDESKIKKIISCNDLYYRNKATFQIKEKIGYYKKKSYEIISIDKCYIVDPKINKILKQLKSYDLKNIDSIVIRASKYSEDTMVILKSNGFIPNFQDLDVTSLIEYKNNHYKVLKGNDFIIENLGDLKFMISPDSFFQVNTETAYKLYEIVREYAVLDKTDKVLDLYSGTGTIGLFLSKYCKSVIGIEINQYAVRDAFKNKEINGIQNVEFICDDASNVNIRGIDIVVIDPPRSGLDKKTLEYLKAQDLKRIVYVSCDPMTLSRDLKLLSDKYEVEEITLVNMFSKTHHVESVCVLNRR